MKLGKLRPCLKMYKVIDIPSINQFSVCQLRKWSLLMRMQLGLTLFIIVRNSPGVSFNMGGELETRLSDIDSFLRKFNEFLGKMKQEQKQEKRSKGVADTGSVAGEPLMGLGPTFQIYRLKTRPTFNGLKVLTHSPTCVVFVGQKFLQNPGSM